MRLIDADYLLKELEDWQADLDDAISGRQLGVTDAMVIAYQIPTVDAVPVRHGRWIPEAYGVEFVIQGIVSASTSLIVTLLIHFCAAIRAIIIV